MQIKNISKALELLPQLDQLAEARHLVAGGARIWITANGGNDTVQLPETLNHNITQLLNCEYERIRKEVEGL